MIQCGNCGRGLMVGDDIPNRLCRDCQDPARAEVRKAPRMAMERCSICKELFDPTKSDSTSVCNKCGAEDFGGEEEPTPETPLQTSIDQAMEEIKASGLEDSPEVKEVVETSIEAHAKTMEGLIGMTSGEVTETPTGKMLGSCIQCHRAMVEGDAAFSFLCDECKEKRSEAHGPSCVCSVCQEINGDVDPLEATLPAYRRCLVCNGQFFETVLQKKTQKPICSECRVKEGEQLDAPGVVLPDPLVNNEKCGICKAEFLETAEGAKNRKGGLILCSECEKKYQYIFPFSFLILPVLPRGVDEENSEETKAYLEAVGNLLQTRLDAGTGPLEAANDVANLSPMANQIFAIYTKVVGNILVYTVQKEKLVECSTCAILMTPEIDGGNGECIYCASMNKQGETFDQKIHRIATQTVENGGNYFDAAKAIADDPEIAERLVKVEVMKAEGDNIKVHVTYTSFSIPLFTELKEDDPCPVPGCSGTLTKTRHGSCSCHMGHPPCSSCVDMTLDCDKCRFEADADDPEVLEVYLPITITERKDALLVAMANHIINSAELPATTWGMAGWDLIRRLKREFSHLKPQINTEFDEGTRYPTIFMAAGSLTCQAPDGRCFEWSDEDGWLQVGAAFELDPKEEPKENSVWCDDCVSLSPKEKDQQMGEPHVCLAGWGVLKHRKYHPHIPRPLGCSSYTKEKKDQPEKGRVCQECGKDISDPLEDPDATVCAMCKLGAGPNLEE